MKINQDKIRVDLLKTAYQAVYAAKEQQLATLQAVLKFAEANRTAGQGNQTEAQAELVLDVIDQRDAVLAAATEIETTLRTMMDEALAKSAVAQFMLMQERKNV